MKTPKTKAVGAKPAKTAAARAKADPRTAPTPVASAKVALRAVEAIAPVAAVATAKPKNASAAPKAAARSPAVAAVATKPTPVPARPAPEAPVRVAAPAPAKPALEGVLPGGGLVATAEKAVAPLATALEAGADQARAAYARVRETGDSFRQVVTESTTATTRGLVEINGKMIDLLRAQGDATVDLWRSAVTAGSLSEAVRAQTSCLRQAYEASAAQWKDIAETAGRVATEATKPLRSAFTPGA